jgi:MFS family permease
VLIDFRPLVKNKNFRWLFILLFLTGFANPIILVALPYQIYHLTGSTLWVGLLSLSELIPLITMGLLGGFLADQYDRRKLLICSLSTSLLASLLLLWNASFAHPYLILLFVAATVLSFASGLSRPVVVALNQSIVDKADFKAVSSLFSLSYGITSIGGPAIVGVMIGHLGFVRVFCVNVSIFIVAILIITLIRISRKVEKKAEELGAIASIKQGVKYAFTREELLGSYVVDIVAMIFGMPNALFPAIAQQLGGASALGFLYAAPSVGGLVISLFSGWSKKIRSYGKAIVISAGLWGVFILGLGFSHSLWLAVVFLALAGAADAVSGIFRSTLWNETIPNNMRGRLAGIEMISYMSGPALGNAEAGLVASVFGVAVSVVSGGVVCVIGVGLCARYFPKFWAYRSASEDKREEKPQKSKS